MKSYSATSTCQRVTGDGGRRVATFRLRFLLALGVLLIPEQDVLQTVEAAAQTKAGKPIERIHFYIICIRHEQTIRCPLAIGSLTQNVLPDSWQGKY